MSGVVSIPLWVLIPICLFIGLMMVPDGFRTRWDRLWRIRIDFGYFGVVTPWFAFEVASEALNPVDCEVWTGWRLWYGFDPKAKECETIWKHRRESIVERRSPGRW